MHRRCERLTEACFWLPNAVPSDRKPLMMHPCRRAPDSSPRRFDALSLMEAESFYSPKKTLNSCLSLVFLFLFSSLPLASKT